jgi:hypothetical protein
MPTICFTDDYESPTIVAPKDPSHFEESSTSLGFLSQFPNVPNNVGCGDVGCTLLLHLTVGDGDGGSGAGAT